MIWGMLVPQITIALVILCFAGCREPLYLFATLSGFDCSFLPLLRSGSSLLVGAGRKEILTGRSS